MTMRCISRMTLKNKKFDCIKMKQEIQEKLWDKIQPVSSQDYFNKLQKMIDKSEFVHKYKQKFDQSIKKAA